jgi:hypothetical protein
LNVREAAEGGGRADGNSGGPALPTKFSLQLLKGPQQHGWKDSILADFLLKIEAIFQYPEIIQFVKHYLLQFTDNKLKVLALPAKLKDPSSMAEKISILADFYLKNDNNILHFFKTYLLQLIDNELKVLASSVHFFLLSIWTALPTKLSLQLLKGSQQHGWKTFAFWRSFLKVSNISLSWNPPIFKTLFATVDWQ